MLSPRELNQALMILIELTQKQYFSEDYEMLMQSKNLKKFISILQLSPFMDDSIIKIGGSLKNSNLNFNEKT